MRIGEKGVSRGWRSDTDPGGPGVQWERTQQPGSGPNPDQDCGKGALIEVVMGPSNQASDPPGIRTVARGP